MKLQIESFRQGYKPASDATNEWYERRMHMIRHVCFSSTMASIVAGTMNSNAA